MSEDYTTRTISLGKQLLIEMVELAGDHGRSVSGEFAFAAKHWVRHCKEMNDERNEPSDDNSRAKPRA